MGEVDLRPTLVTHLDGPTRHVCGRQKQGVGPIGTGGHQPRPTSSRSTSPRKWLFPPEPSMRVFQDMLVYAYGAHAQVEHCLYKWLPHREAGSTAAQGANLAPGRRLRLHRGWYRSMTTSVDGFAPAPQLLLQLAHRFLRRDLQDSVPPAAFWATVLKEEYGAKDERSLRMRFHTQAAGVPDGPGALQQRRPPRPRGARPTGRYAEPAQNSLDEALALPTRRPSRIAVRTQRIALEPGLELHDLLAGSYRRGVDRRVGAQPTATSSR